MELKNRSFQYGKVALAVRTQKHQLQFVLKVAAVCTHTRVVKHATVELLGQWCSGRSNATPRWDAVSSVRRRESCYGRCVAGAHAPHVIVHGIWVRAIGRPQQRWDEIWCIAREKLHAVTSSVSWWHWLQKVFCYGTNRRQKMLTKHLLPRSR